LRANRPILREWPEGAVREFHYTAGGFRGVSDEKAVAEFREAIRLDAGYTAPRILLVASGCRSGA
jgi:hypothetical protein